MEPRNPYEMDCTQVPREAIDAWVKGDSPTEIEATDPGCRLVSSHPDGAVIIKWRYLDALGSASDARTIQRLVAQGDHFTAAPGVTGNRTENEVDPNRTSEVVTFIGSRVLWIYTDVTLDRPQDLTDMRRMNTTIVKAYDN